MTHAELHMVPSRAPSRSGLLQALLRLVVLILSREKVEEDASKSVHTTVNMVISIRTHDRAVAAVASLLRLGQPSCAAQSVALINSALLQPRYVGLYVSSTSTASQDPHCEHHNGSIDTASKSFQGQLCGRSRHHGAVVWRVSEGSIVRHSIGAKGPGFLLCFSNNDKVCEYM